MSQTRDLERQFASWLYFVFIFFIKFYFIFSFFIGLIYSCNDVLNGFFLFVFSLVVVELVGS